MKYDPIMCMMVDDTVKTKDEAFIIEAKKEGRHYKAIVNGEEKEIVKYYTHKGFTDIKLTKAKDSNTIDKAIRSCDYAYGTTEIKDVNGKWVVFHGGKYVHEFDNSDDAEAFVREKGWH